MRASTDRDSVVLAMKLAKHDLLAALRLRYDHYSAQSILELALARAGLPEQDAYALPELAAFRAALAKVGDRLANVEARLDALLEAGGGTSSSDAPERLSKEIPKDLSKGTTDDPDRAKRGAATDDDARPGKRGSHGGAGAKRDATTAAIDDDASASRDAATAETAAADDEASTAKRGSDDGTGATRSVAPHDDAGAGKRGADGAPGAKREATAVTDADTGAGKRGADGGPGARHDAATAATDAAAGAKRGAATAATDDDAGAVKRGSDGGAGAKRGGAKAGPDDASTPRGGATVVATTILLAGVQVGDGEQVLVCGGADVLGDWDPARAPRMKREGETWLATVEVPAGAAVPFKFLRRTADGTVIWEDGDDRELVAKPRIEATWR